MEEKFLQVDQAVNILNQALNAAASKGIFSLKDASLIHNSLELVNGYFARLQENIQEKVEDHTESQVSE